MKVGSIVTDCFDFELVVGFWQSALGYVPREPGTDDWIVLCDPKGMGPNLSFQKYEQLAAPRARIHLDLYTQDQNGEVERLERLGATRYPWDYEPDDDFVVMADPEGNLFCVIQKAVQ